MFPLLRQRLRRGNGMQTRIWYQISADDSRHPENAAPPRRGTSSSLQQLLQLAHQLLEPL